MRKQALKNWLPALAVMLFMVAAAPQGQAASLQPSWLEVRVLNRNTGTPVAAAAVCLGTNARLDQFGARRSNRQGVVRFDDIGAHPLLLTVSGKGYQGHRQALEPLYESRVLVIKLATGGGGAQCDAPLGDTAASAAGLSLEAVRVRANGNASSASVLVAARASAPVNQIRISEQADFGDAHWQAYKALVPFTLSAGKGAKRLYVQVRRVAEAQGASIEVLSPVKQVVYRAGG